MVDLETDDCLQQITLLSRQLLCMSGIIKLTVLQLLQLHLEQWFSQKKKLKKTGMTARVRNVAEETYILTYNIQTASSPNEFS